MKILLFITALCCGFQSIAAQAEYQRVALDLHNQYRSKHHVGPLQKSDDLNGRAVRCAQYYAATGRLDHTCPHTIGAQVGENSIVIFISQSDVDTAKFVINRWYSEEKNHDYNGDLQQQSGHFSQIVWKNSSELGFGIGRMGTTTVAIALYKPSGNVVGQFKDNVFPP